MILETGNNKSPAQCAFTLIELVLVMMLLVVAVCMVAPRMSDFVRGRALDSEARRLVALMHAGQARAVSEGMPVVLWLDEKQGTIGLEQESPPKGGDPKAENLTISENVKITLVNTGSTTATTFNHLPAIRFMPDGTIDEDSPQTVQLMQGSETLLLSELQNRTGYEVKDNQK
ncbi:MAG TPA: GspH/FimT family pseudopilin [Pseudomonadales bacterium]|nr:GspH/FimT family pseudopilin [Pseudomonadales bacterium]